MKKKALIVVNLAGFLHFLWNDIEILRTMGYEITVAMNEESAAGPNLIEIPKLNEMKIKHYHIDFDTYEEARLAGKSFGSTKSGIAPFYSDKYAKIGFQVCELFGNEDELKDKTLSY